MHAHFEIQSPSLAPTSSTPSPIPTYLYGTVPAKVGIPAWSLYKFALPTQMVSAKLWQGGGRDLGPNISFKTCSPVSRFQQDVSCYRRNWTLAAIAAIKICQKTTNLWSPNKQRFRPWICFTFESVWIQSLHSPHEDLRKYKLEWFIQKYYNTIHLHCKSYSLTPAIFDTWIDQVCMP